MPRQWFNCWECGRTKANEYSECAYCGGDVVVMIDEKADMAQCPCCKGSGFIPKEGSIVDEIRALEWRGPNAVSSCALCGGFKMYGHYAGRPLAAILWRLK
jgi:hypothetical protein